MNNLRITEHSAAAPVRRARRPVAPEDTVLDGPFLTLCSCANRVGVTPTEAGEGGTRRGWSGRGLAAFAALGQ